MPDGRAWRVAVLLPLAMLAAGRAAAQSTSEPQLTFSIAGGIASAGGELWHVPKQAVYVVGTSPPEFDTLNLARQLRPGMAATLGATLHRSAHLGFTAEVGYFEVASESRCDSTGAFRPDPAAEAKNAQACSNAQGQHIPTNIIGIQVGAIWRIVSQERFQPYVRGSLGVGLIGNSYILTEGDVQAPTSCPSTLICTIVLLDGESNPEATLLGSLAAGISIAISPGYRFRFEGRDLITQLPAAERAANPTTALAPVHLVLRHVPVFTAGIDVVLERRRGRRY